jgi:hypothetical protein
MKQKYFYKVTDQLNRSCRTRNPALRIQYKQGVSVRPSLDGSLSLVFDTYKNAKKFSLEFEKIWKCEVIKPRKIKWLVGSGSNDISKFWGVKNKKRWLEKHNDFCVKHDAFFPWKIPKGTYGAKEVKLIEEMI